MKLLLLIFALLIAQGPVFAQQLPRDITGNVAVPVLGVFSGANTASATAILPAAIGKTTYVCGLTISGLGATALTPVVATIATLVGGLTSSISYVYPAGATVAATPIIIQLALCIPASAINTAITVTVPGAAGNTATQISVSGYQL
jgi:hypothetical protein